MTTVKLKGKMEHTDPALNIIYRMDLFRVLIKEKKAACLSLCSGLSVQPQVYFRTLQLGKVDVFQSAVLCAGLKCCSRIYRLKHWKMYPLFRQNPTYTLCNSYSFVQRQYKLSHGTEAKQRSYFMLQQGWVQDGLPWTPAARELLPPSSFASLSRRAHSNWLCSAERRSQGQVHCLTSCFDSL